MVVKKYSILLLMFMSAAWAAETHEIQKEKTMVCKKLDQDTPLTTASGCTFTAQKGWSISSGPDMVALTEPDGELTVTLLENNEATAQEAVCAAWKKVQPDFARTIQHTVQGVATDGWDDIVQTIYDTGTQENRIVFAIARKCTKTWYVALLDGTKGALDRRVAGIMLIADSFKVPGVHEESFAGKEFAGKKVHELDAARLKEFATFVDDARKACKVPGAAIGIVQDGKIIYAQGFGVRELDKPETVTPNTLFMIGSTTKALTTFMMAKLVDENKFTWDTPATKIMPGFVLGDKSTTEQLHMNHMVSASTGMPRQDIEFFFNYDCATPEFRLAEMRDMKPTTGFGETFQYSNSMVSAAGYIAAHASAPDTELGKTYDAVMQSRVFDPIGMTATTFDFNQVTKVDHAAPHSRNLKNNYVPLLPSDERWVISLRPAGGVWSNVLDMAQYMIVELQNGVNARGEKVISAENLLKRREAQIKISDKMAYGLGLMTEDDHGVLSVGHGGNTMGFSSAMFFLPEYNIGLVVLTNAQGAHTFTGAVSRKFMEVLFDGKPQAQELVKVGVEQLDKIYAKNLESIVFEPEASWLKQFVGTYTHPTLGKVVIREIAGGADTGGVELDAGCWKSKIGQKKEADGALKLLLLDKPFAGLALLPQESNGSMQLILEMPQHKYVFERK